jgi:hypothetical protein
MTLYRRGAGSSGGGGGGGVVPLATLALAASFIFRPGGVAGGNVFTTWTALANALIAVPGPKTVYFDSMGTGSVDLGSFTLGRVGEQVSWVGNQADNQGLGTILTGTVTFAHNEAPILIANCDVRFVSPLSVTDGTFFIEGSGTATTEWRDSSYDGDQATASGVLYYVDINGTLRIELTGATEILHNPGPTSIFVRVNTDATPASGFFFMAVADQSFIDQGVIDWNGASQPALSVSAVHPSVFIDPSQAGGTLSYFFMTSNNPILGGGAYGATQGGPWACHGNVVVVLPNANHVLSPREASVFDIELDSTAYGADHQVSFPNPPNPLATPGNPGLSGGYTKFVRNTNGAHNVIVECGGGTATLAPSTHALYAFTAGNVTKIA